MDNPVSTQFPVCFMAFQAAGDGDEIATETVLAEVTEAGEGFAEVAFTYGEERIYLAFRTTDLQRAIKEAAS